MSVASPKCFVRLREPIAGIDHIRFIDQQRFAEAHCLIDRVASELGVSTINDFYVYRGEHGTGPVQWHSAEDGLTALRAVKNHIEAHTDLDVSTDCRQSTLNVLERLEELLGEAASNDISFCVVGNY
jgi:hypothetical protein